MVANQSRRVLATLRIEVQKCYHFASEPILKLDSVGTVITTCIIIAEERCHHHRVLRFYGFQHRLHHQNNRSGRTTE